MNKKILLLICLSTMLVLLSGCIRFDISSPETPEQKILVVEGGYQIKGSDSDPNTLLLDELVSNEVITELELHSLLQEGLIVDEDGDSADGSNLDNMDIDYTQTITLNNFAVTYGEPEWYDEKVYYLNTNEKGVDFTYSVTFKDPAEMSGFTDSETLEMLGRTFTIGKETTKDELVLYNSDATTFLNFGQQITIEDEGNLHTLEIVDYNESADGGNGNFVISVNGVNQTFIEGDAIRVDGLFIYAQDLFVTNIPSVAASANLFIGLAQIVLSNGDIEMNGEVFEGLSYSIVGDDFDSLSQLNISLDLKYLDEDQGYDRDTDSFLEEGEVFQIPIFKTVEMMFVGSADESAKNNFYAFVAPADSRITVK